MHRHRHLWVVAEGEENAGHVVMLPLPESALLLVILMYVMWRTCCWGCNIEVYPFLRMPSARTVCLYCRYTPFLRMPSARTVCLYCRCTPFLRMPSARTVCLNLKTHQCHYTLPRISLSLSPPLLFCVSLFLLFSLAFPGPLCDLMLGIDSDRNVWRFRRRLPSVRLHEGETRPRLEPCGKLLVTASSSWASLSRRQDMPSL